MACMALAEIHFISENVIPIMLPLIPPWNTLMSGQIAKANMLQCRSSWTMRGSGFGNVDFWTTNPTHPPNIPERNSGTVFVVLQALVRL